MTLAHELGVFDYGEEDSTTTEQQHLRDTRLRIRRLLYLYTSQLSLRLGCSNIFPQGDQSTSWNSTDAQSNEQSYRGREIVLSGWIAITKLLTTATHMFFASKSATRQMLTSYRYLSLLEHFQPLLTKWHGDFIVPPSPSKLHSSSSFTDFIS